MLCLMYLPGFSSSVEVSGNISSNTTWDADTVFVVGDVFVDDTYTLTINPGVEVIVNGFYKIEVQGTILAVGTETDSILFTAANTSEGWGSLFFNNTPSTNDTSRFSYCITEYGNTTTNGGAFTVDNVSKLILSNCDIRFNGALNAIIYASQSTVTIRDCKIHDNQDYGVMVMGVLDSCIVYNNQIYNNSNSGIYAGYSTKSIISGNLIYNNNGWGVFSYLSHATFVNNTITGNTSGGINFRNTSENELYNNIIYSNNVTQIQLETTCDPNFYNCNIEGGVAGFIGDGAGAEYTGTYSACIDSDPEFVSSGDHPFSIPQFSPCQDMGLWPIPGFDLPDYDLAGNQRVSNDFIDIGAYEYYIRTDTVAGTWTKANSPYLITGNIYIADGTTLTIEPGVDVIFQGFYKIDVQGKILAEGTEVDSILFTAANTEEGWNRIIFSHTPVTNDTSRFSHCIIEYGNSYLNNGSSFYANGGAFFVYYSHKLNISNSIIRNNRGVNSSLYFYESSVNIENCDIYQNTNYGILAMGRAAVCKIYNNKIHDNTGSGIYPGYSSDNMIVSNLIYNNGGWGIINYISTSTFINNTITDNAAGGINFRNTSSNYLYNNIIYGNAVTQVELDESSDPNFYYCDIEGDSSGFTGVGAGTNYSGEYADCVDSDPLFVNTNSANYTLQEGSPCLDAGIPDLTGWSLPATDLAGNPRVVNNRIDMGAYEGPYPALSIGDVSTELPNSFELSQNYPNPFNPVTTIQYELPAASHVKIEIFDLVGQKVQTLVNEQKQAGTYNIRVNGSDLSSGIYFYYIEAGSFMDSKKMILLK